MSIMNRDNTVQRCDFRMHDVIDGKYRVTRVLGSNPVDQRFKVVDSYGHEYVLKLLKLWEVEADMQYAMVASAESEIKSCRIKSNYLPEIVDTGAVQGNPYVVIPFSSSTDLSHFFGRSKLDLIRVSKEILYGLRDLHVCGKVHGKLIPENILLSDDGHVSLTNYITLGERGKVLFSRNRMLGMRFVDQSLAFQSPECYQLEKIPTILPSIDIFAFGVILFKLLTNELPFGRLNTESDWIHYQDRAKNNDWNRDILLRDEQRDMWLSILEICLSADAGSRARDVNEILEKFPVDEIGYVSVPGSQTDVPSTVLNGLMLHVMQGENYGTYYRLPELMQLPRRIITVGRANDAIFNIIQLPEVSTSYISRRHCTFEYDDETDTWYLRDGQWDKEKRDKWSRSLNGTFLNSEEITDEGIDLLPGDIISIGDFKLRVEAY